jgi:triosephosphate isomerase
MKQKPVFVVNCKAYENASGEALIALAKELASVAQLRGVQLILAVPATEIRAVAAAVSIPVFAQHVDAVNTGAHTGYLPANFLVDAGASGTLLNHSEHRIEHDLAAHVTAARRAGLRVIVCARDATEVKILRNLDVEYIAVEPPELIGGDISIATARPELISASVKHCSDCLLVGAGIKTREDVEKAMELGAKGVLIASGIVRAQKPKDALLALATGW